MKKLLLILLFFWTQISVAQIVNIPDANFKAELIIDGVDTNGDGEIQVSEAEATTKIYVYNSNISSLEGISSFTNLSILSCPFNNITSLDISSLSNLTVLDCRGNLISSIDFSGLTNLTSLKLAYNQLTSLDVSGLSNLQVIESGNNQLTTVNLSGLSNLTKITMHKNNLTSIDVSDLVKLETLHLQDNNLTNIDLLNLTDLSYLNLIENQISNINTTGLLKLRFFNCSNNLLTSLDVSHLENLLVLRCDNNFLTGLDVSGLNILHDLASDNNQLSTINLAGCTSLGVVNCNNNLLTEIDLSNDLSNLSTLHCDNNQLTSLDVSNQLKLRSLKLNNNLLETLSMKNGSIEEFVEIDSNPGLRYICTDPEQRIEIQNLINGYGYSNCVVNSYCSFIPGGDVYHLQGNVKLDMNANGCDSSDLNFPFLQLKVTDTNNNTDIYSTDISGSYDIAVYEGTYSIEYQFPYLSYFDITPPSFTVNFPTDTSPFQQDICLTPNGTYNDLQVLIIPIDEARPGFDTDYKIIYANVGTTPLSGNVTFTFEDDVVDFVNATTTPDTQSTGQLSWSFSNLAPLDFVVIDMTMNLNTPTETPPLNGGDILCYEASINPTTNDENAMDNTFSLKQTVVNSFDPNDKTCLEGDVITPDLVGEYVHYLIRFENTGSASAVNIVVKDIIDTSKFDMSSFVPMTSSHEYIARVQNTNEVEFIFEGINLPFDDANNDGFVMFKIKTLPSLMVGDTFENSAEIYFDFNFPIITNTEQTTIDTTASTDDFSLNSTISIYPNPTSNQLQIKSQLAFDSVIIYDLTGKELKRIVSTQNRLTQEIDVSNLKGGVYYISIFSGKSKKVMKFIKA